MRSTALATAFVAAVVALNSTSPLSAPGKPSDNTAAAEPSASTTNGSSVLSQRYVGATPAQLAAQRQALSATPAAKIQSDARGIPTFIAFEKDGYAIPPETTSPAGKAALGDLMGSLRAILLAEGTEN